MNTTPESSLLFEVLDDLVTLAGRDNVEWADEIRRKIERLREAESALSEAPDTSCSRSSHE